MNKTVAENIVVALTDKGIIRPRDEERALELVKHMTKYNYIPGGGRTRKVKNKRSAPAGERCGCVEGNDVQSGPWYCGEPAAWMADDDEKPGFILYVCADHEYRLDKHLEDAPEQMVEIEW